MFEALKKKLTGWFGKKETEEEKETDKEKQEEKGKIKKKSQKKEAKKEKPQKNEKVLKKKFEEKREEVKETEVNAEEIKKISKESEVRVEESKEISDAKVEFFGEEEKEAKETKEGIEKKADEVKEELEEKKGFFAKLAGRLITSELKEEDFNEFFDEFETILLENNVALEVVDKIREKLEEELVGKQFKKSEVEGEILEALKKAVGDVLIEGKDLLKKIKEKKGEFVILFFGINGSGKTTSIAKLAHRLKEEGISCVLVAGDTFRAASIEQLEIHANKIGVPIVKGEYGKDPAAVGFDGVQYAKKHGVKAVLIDTAGRMYTKSNLLKEMEKIVRVCKPDLKIFVGESITGNDAISQAKTFNETVGIDGIILSKADVDEKAGTILSVSYVTGKPILYLGVGQEYKDLKEFKKEDVLKGLGLE